MTTIAGSIDKNLGKPCAFHKIQGELRANMPLQLVALLATLDVDADSAVTRGWDRLSNGALLEAAVQANFSAILTRSSAEVSEKLVDLWDLRSRKPN
jgi:hypothetical protein